MRFARTRTERTAKRSQTMASKGILGRKLGMTQVWDAENRVIPVTVIEAGPCRVVQLKTPERDGYSAVQLSFGETKPRRLSKPELGHLKAAGRSAVAATSRSCGSPTSPASSSARSFAADVFDAGERVDVTGISKGKGFSGVMQRHNFKGLGASHGNAQEAPCARLDRRVRHAGPRVQGHEDGRPDGQRASDDAQSRGRRRRRRTRAAARSRARCRARADRWSSCATR